MKSKALFAKKHLRFIIALCCLPFSGLAQSIYIQPGASVTVSGAGTIRLEGTLENNGTFSAGDGTVVFQEVVGNGTPEIGGTSPTTFNNITVNLNTKTLHLLRNIGVEGTVNFTNGLFDLNGFDVTLGANGLLMNESETSRITGLAGGSLIKTMSLNSPAGVNPGNLGATISSSANLGLTTISRSHVPNSVSGLGLSIERAFNISPANNANLDATLRFDYFDAELNGVDESNLILWKNESSTWVPQAGAVLDDVLNFLELENIPGFSTWTAAEGCKDNMGNFVDPQTWFADADGDGFGDSASTPLLACDQPTGYVSDNTDCNDGNDQINPATTEVCNGIDDNCDGTVDNLPGGVGNWVSANVGNAGGTGSFPTCNAQPNDVFTVQASGFSTSSSDVLHLVSLPFCGNGEIIARVTNVSGGGWAGITLRESLAQGSKKVALKTQANGNIRREIRSATNAASSNLNYSRPGHAWLRLVRSGSTFTGFTSNNGSAWTFAFSATVSMAGCIHAGLFAESINANVVTTAVFDHVSVTGGGLPFIAPGSPVAGIAAPDFEVYPNPTTGELNIDLSTYRGQSVRLELFDVHGKAVKVVDIAAVESMERLDLSGLQNGVYVIRVKLVRAENVLPLPGWPDATKRVVVHGLK